MRAREWNDGAWLTGARLAGASFLSVLLFLPLVLVLLLQPLLAAPARGATEAAAAIPDASAAPKTKKAKASKSKKTAPTAPAEAAKPAPKHRKVGVSPAYIVGDSSAHFINESAPKIVPFPENSKAFNKAFAENRRDQLGDAEKTARAAKSPDRWRSVLFMLHGLPEHNDSETCFWRVLSFYRLGEIERARKIREGCELPAKDSSTLNAEDARVSGTPSMEDLQAAANAADVAGGPTSKDAGAGPDAGTPASAPYTGPNPQRRD
jgi:hypothetical protein